MTRHIHMLTAALLCTGMSLAALPSWAGAPAPVPQSDAEDAGQDAAAMAGMAALVPGANVSAAAVLSATDAGVFDARKAMHEAHYWYVLPQDLDLLVSPSLLNWRSEITSLPGKRVAKAPGNAAAWRHNAANRKLIGLNTGYVVLDVSAIKPGAQDLSEAADVKVNLPKVTVGAQLSASAGRDESTSDLWQKNHAEVEMRTDLVPKTQLVLTGAETFGQSYREASGIGEVGSDAHMIQTDERSARLAADVKPLSDLKVEVGISGNSKMTKDTTASDRADKSSNMVETQNEEVFLLATLQPLPGLVFDGGTAARTAAIVWRATQSKSAVYQSADPHIGVKMRLFDGTEVSGSLGRVTSGYNTDAFVSYARQATRSETVPVEPDHALQFQTVVRHHFGPALVAVDYTALRNGTVTEFGFSDSGVQAPVSTTLESRNTIGVKLSLPLADFGVPDTTVSGDAEVRDSRVLDPVTGEYRRASGEVPAKLTLRMVRAFSDESLRFGVTGEVTAAQTAYQTKEISETAASGTLGAFVAFRPGPYELNLNVDGLIGTPEITHRLFVGSRAVVQLPASVRTPPAGPTVRLSLKRLL